MVFTGDASRHRGMADHAHGGVCILDTEESGSILNQDTGNTMRTVTGDAPHVAVGIKWEEFRPGHRGGRGHADLVSMFLLKGPAGIHDAAIMAGETHLRGSLDLFRLKRGQGGAASVEEKRINPAVMADGAFFGRTGISWKLMRIGFGCAEMEQ